VYAIHLADLLLVLRDEFALRTLLKPLVENQHLVEVTPGMFDGVALVLNCDDERAAAVVKVIRLRYRRDQVRCYRSTSGRGSWRQVRS
jgi:hypothetical protein